MSSTHYEITIYVVVDEDSRARVHRMTTRYYAVSITRLLALLREAGFCDCARLNERIYQPILVARKGLDRVS